MRSYFLQLRLRCCSRCLTHDLRQLSFFLSFFLSFLLSIFPSHFFFRLSSFLCYFFIPLIIFKKGLSVLLPVPFLSVFLISVLSQFSSYLCAFSVTFCLRGHPKKLKMLKKLKKLPFCPSFKKCKTIMWS